MNIQLMVCPNCQKGVMAPLQDSSKIPDGSPASSAVFIKAWCCTHCNDNIMLHNGSLARQMVQEPKR